MSDPHWPPWPIRPYSTQTHTETVAAGPASDPEPFPDPVINQGVSFEEFLVSDYTTGLERREELFLVRADDEPERAYRRIRSLFPIERNGRRWGEVVLCLVLERQRDDMDGIVFVEPPPDSPTFVAIKVLSRQVVEEYLQGGGTENPYNEIAAMQAIGDGIHVINCLEALEDTRQHRNQLFIVMPFCEGGDLWSVIHENPDYEGPGIPEEYGRRCFREIIECVEYLQRQGVCHGDISAENVLIRNGRCILIDLGCCFRVPRAQNWQRVMSRPFQQRFGKNEYMAPEIFFLQFNFDGFAIDIWSAGVTLFHMLTGDLIERTPVWAVVQRNLNNFIRNNPRLQNVTRHMNGVACHLIHRMLLEPATRYTLQDVTMSTWVSALVLQHVPMDRYLEAAE
uniref:Protein kinase domain-containing protein n=1 Tax=Odontella aurita TaxID=265563 RepID=A0A7S4N5E3_9STRA|mmetsp:Transcript_48538/g.146408  ORF Transcript_48538/g.146408 Transcript_48538/m.146408 type:complete len:395 (+) Transcript_48538:426-1610(+)